MEIVSKSLFDQMDRTKRVVDAIIESENGYQFTNDKFFLENITDFALQEQVAAPRGPSPADGSPPQQ